MKKLLLLLITLTFFGCSSTAPLTVVVGSESYDWKQWDCYNFVYGEYILSVGYIPEISDSRGILFLKDSESGIDTIHSLQGVQHYWNWEDFQIVVKSDGTGFFYDFSGAEPGETRIASEMYNCTAR